MGLGYASARHWNAARARILGLLGSSDGVVGSPGLQFDPGNLGALSRGGPGSGCWGLQGRGTGRSAFMRHSYRESERNLKFFLMSRVAARRLRS